MAEMVIAKVEIEFVDAGPGPLTPSLNEFQDLAIDLDAALQRHRGAETGEQLKRAHDQVMSLLAGESATILSALRIAAVALR
jgi:hypothetical protein